MPEFNHWFPEYFWLKFVLYDTYPTKKNKYEEKKSWPLNLEIFGTGNNHVLPFSLSRVKCNRKQLVGHQRKLNAIMSFKQIWFECLVVCLYVSHSLGLGLLFLLEFELNMMNLSTHEMDYKKISCLFEKNVDFHLSRAIKITII